MTTTISTPDHTIAERLVAGDESVLGEAHAAHAGVVYRVAMATARNAEIAHDVTQDVFAHLWRHPERFDPDRGSLRGYLITRTRSRTLDVLRSETSRSRRERTEGRAAIVHGADIAEVVADSDTAERLRAALAELPEMEQAVIKLAYFGGRSYREVAEELGIPEGTAKSRIRSGLGRLRSSLGEFGVPAVA